MNKQICPDCGQEKEIGTRTGICKQCSARKSNAKYHKRPYVKLIDIDPSKRNKIRKTTKEEVKEERKEIKQSSNELYSEEIKEIVSKDIDYILKCNKINLPKNMNFGIAFEILNNTLKGISGITEYLKAEEEFNKLENDYRHSFESSKTKEEMEYWNQIYKCFLDKRREIKNVVSEFESGGYIFKKLSENKEFVKEFDEAYDVYKKIHDMNEKGQFRQKSESLIVKNSNSCIGKRSDTNYLGLSKYNVIIKPVTPNQQVFSRFTYAKTEKEAINNVLDFIKSIDYKISFKNPDGITVIKITNDSYEDSKEYL